MAHTHAHTLEFRPVALVGGLMLSGRRRWMLTCWQERRVWGVSEGFWKYLERVSRTNDIFKAFFSDGAISAVMSAHSQV